MEFTRETIVDYFQDKLERSDTILFLPEVKNDSGLIIFSLTDLEFDQSNIIIAPEKKLKHHINESATGIIYHLIVDDNKTDTIDIHIEEYELERRKFLIFDNLTRYWICKGGGPDYTDGRFVFNSENKEWGFISGRQKTEQYWTEIKQYLEEKRNGH